MMPEIIYPSVIIVSLSTIFYLFWKKAYQIETNEIEVKSESPRRVADTEEEGGGDYEAGKFSDFWSNQETVRESDDIIAVPTKESAAEISEAMKKAEDLFKKGRYISAEKWFIEAAKEKPKDAKIYSRLGIIYLQQKNFLDAEEALKESTKLDDGVASRFFNLSYALWCQSKFKQASDYAKRALRLEPENSKYKAWLEKLRSEGF
jgi:tetratricopeptide (TPR) repeat protein